MSAGTAAPISAIRPIDDRLVTGMIPGTTGCRDAAGRQVVHQREVLLGPEEELGDREVRQAQLLGQAVAVGLACPANEGGRPGGPPPRSRSRRWPGPARPARWRKRSSPSAASGSVGGSPPSAIRFSTPALRKSTRISASSSRVWATQIRWAIGVRRGGPQHADHQVVGALAGRPPAPVGDRHERRPQRLQLHQRLDQAGVLGVVLRGEELERVRPARRPAGRRCGACPAG